MTLIAPVNDMSDVLRGQSLMHDNSTVVLYIGAVSADHAVKFRQISLFDLGFGTSGTDIYLMTVCPGFGDRLLGACRCLCFVVDQCAVDVKKYDFAHVASIYSSLSGSRPPRNPLILSITPGSSAF